MKIISPEDVQAKLLLERLRNSITPIDTDRTRFEASCVNFRMVCAQISSVIGKEFKGGFDEMALISEYMDGLDLTTNVGKQKAIEMNSLIGAWTGANFYCTYEASRIGLKQPEWWYDCWQQVEPNNDESESEN